MIVAACVCVQRDARPTPVPWQFVFQFVAPGVAHVLSVVMAAAPGWWAIFWTTPEMCGPRAIGVGSSPNAAELEIAKASTPVTRASGARTPHFLITYPLLVVRLSRPQAAPVSHGCQLHVNPTRPA